MTQPSLRDQIDQERRLGRFFTKLLDEALYYAADKVVFARHEKDQMRATLLKDRNEIKYIDLKASWLEPIRSWLQARRPTAFSDGAKDSSAPFVSVALSNCVRADLVETAEGIELRSVRAIPLRQAYETAGFFGHSSAVWSKLLAKENGLILVCSTKTEDLNEALTLVRCLSSALSAAISNEARESVELVASSREDLLIVPIPGVDPLEALVAKAKLWGPEAKPQIAGVIGTAIAAGNCKACLALRDIPTNVINQIPSELYPLPKQEKAGKGCAACEQRGTRGVVPLQSVIDVDERVSRALSQGFESERLIDLVYPAGTRSLLEDGLAKVEAGKLTLAAVKTVVADLPLAYKQRKNKGTYHRDESLEIQDDFFVTDKAVDPVTQGKSAFPANKLGTVRDKPLLLIAEDDPDQRSILEMVFKSANYNVQAVGDGEDAWKSVQHERPDLIVTDLMMPKVDGGQLLSRLKADQNLKTIPVLVLTVVSDSEKEYALLDLGADDYCEKTIQRKILLKRIENLLRRSSSVNLGD